MQPCKRREASGATQTAAVHRPAVTPTKPLPASFVMVAPRTFAMMVTVPIMMGEGLWNRTRIGYDHDEDAAGFATKNGVRIGRALSPGSRVLAARAPG